MYIYITKKKSGQIVSVNRTVEGASMELYGLDIETIGDQPANREALQSALSTVASVECKTSEGEPYIVEQHYMGG